VTIPTNSYRFYGDLARWWPLISLPEDYAEEAAFAASLLSGADIPVGEVLELGSFNMGAFHARIGWTSLLAAGLTMTLIAAAFYLVAVGSRDAVVPRTRR
jgi:hypothetical protein